MVVNQLTKIRYVKDPDGKAEGTTRYIIPTYLPNSNVRAVDVTDLSVSDREKMVELLDEYKSYVKDRKKTIFSFEVWAEHCGHSITPKWRNFASDQLTNLND